jgi:uncharacterized protein (TIGR04255 family)
VVTLAESLTKLSLPDVHPFEFERNFIKTAVCELRFPTLLEYETKPPTQLQKELRKEFPHYERAQVNLVGPGAVENEIRYLFRSKKKDWVVSFKAFAVALETSHYTNFEEFAGRLERLLTKSKPLLDSDFFTRVGLRYVNEIVIEDGELSGWISDALVSPLAEGIYGTVERFFQEVRGFAETGRYTLRHGMVRADQAERQVYTLDFDFYEEDVQFESVLPMISEFNKQSFRFFMWVIGPKARDRLGQATARPAR